MSLTPIEGADVDLMTLKDYAQRIEEDFFNSGVMSQISLSGYPQPEISVEDQEEELLRYNLTFDDISSAIQPITRMFQAVRSNRMRKNY